MHKTVLIFIFIFLSSVLCAQNFTLSGQVSDSKTGEDLVGATVFISGTTNGVAANSYGFYSLTLPKGSYTVIFKFLGYQEIEKVITLDKNTTLNIELNEKSKDMNEVVISAKAEESTPTGVARSPSTPPRKASRSIT